MLPCGTPDFTGRVLDSKKVSHMHSRDVMICNYIMIYYIKSIYIMERVNITPYIGPIK